MEHFSEQVWADFVRGIATPEYRARVESHLASCKDCTATYKFWGRLQEVASHESTYRPPENSVRMSKLEFAARQSQDPVEITANLIFDTMAHPLALEMRSVATALRQMLYEADGLTVDLQVDTQSESNKVHLIGQVLDARAPRARLSDASVMLWTTKGLPLIETRTNNLGEFTMEFASIDNLRLSIQVGRTVIRIPLDSKLNAGKHFGNDRGN